MNTSDKSKEKVESKENIQGFIATVNTPALTDEQIERGMKQLHRDLQSRRKNTERALINSAEDAKKFHSD